MLWYEIANTKNSKSGEEKKLRMKENRESLIRFKWSGTIAMQMLTVPIYNIRV